MILRLDLPDSDASLRGGSVTRWHKKEGDTFAFGDVICEIAVDDFAVLRRTARATLLSGKRRKKLKGDLERRKGKVYLEMAVTAADGGIVRKILVNAGEPAEVGDTMAIVSTSDSDELVGTEADWRSSPRMRAVCNVLDNDDQLTEGNA